MLLNDIKFAVRTMRRAPLFTAAVVLTVMLALAANTVIFSVVNSVMIRPLPFRNPGRLVQVAEKNDKLNLSNFGASILNFLSWREQSQSFEGLGAIGYANYTLSGSGEPEQLSGNRISSALTRILGIDPIAGRTFTDDEEKPNGAAVAMIGEGLWRRRFGADPAVVGRSVNLNGAPTTIVGIAPVALNLITGGDVYTPLAIDPSKELRLNHVLSVFGRLKSGVSVEQAQAEMDIVSKHLGQQFPEIHDWGIHILSLFDTFVSPELKTGLLALLCSVAFVLLIACANIANLLLARASARQSEMAVRTAIGASRSRLVRQLLIESTLLSVVGGTAGFLGAVWIVRLLNHTLPPNTLAVPAVVIDARVLLFAIGLTLITGLLFGVVPAWRSAKVDLNIVLKSGGRGSSTRMSTRLRTGLAAAELALATMLLIGAGLFIRSLVNLQGVRLGFAPHGLITFQLAPPTSKYPLNTKAATLYQDLMNSLRSIPGVSNAAASSGIPFGAGSYTTHPMITTGQSVLPPGTLVPIDWRTVTPGYFKTMGIPMVAGRDFTDADGPSALPVIVVSQATAHKFWGDGDPIGQTLRRSALPAIAFTVIGVVGDVRSLVLTKESPALYYPIASRVWPLMDIAVRTDGSPEALLPSIRQKVHDLDAELALANVRTMDEWLSNTSAQPRLNTVLLSAFAFVALLIASIGIYGVLAYSVSQRVGEIGLRMALGATPRNVLRLIVGEGMKVASIGIGVGLVGSFALGRTISTLVYGVPVDDPATFASVGVALATVALAACVIPALRASRVHPMEALREQ